MKRKMAALCLSMTIAVSALGCGDTKEENNTGAVENTENQGAATPATESVMENTENNTESASNQLQLGNAVELPVGFEGNEGETDAHGELERVIAEYCNVSEEDYQNIRYYYNYVDLNGDSKNEILAMVLGEKWNEDGGNYLLWIDDSGDSITKDSVKQEFRGVSAPVYISNHMTEGYRDLILCNNIGMNNETTNSGYVLLTWNGERYQELGEGTVLDDLEGYEGTAIIANDMERDYNEQTYHFLGEAMNIQK